jgi:hypothetical protein
MEIILLFHGFISNFFISVVTLQKYIQYKTNC